MPELPEVETVRRGLERVLRDARFAHVEVRRPDLRFAFPVRFAERLAGSAIVDLTRRAKYILASLDTGETLIMHLGMTGRFLIEEAQGRTTPGSYVYAHGANTTHDHVVFHMRSGTRITYNDARRFGFMLLTPTHELSSHPVLRALGPEPLDVQFSAAYLAGRAAQKNVNLKTLLMDQRIVAGLGNIYVSEALHRARLSPGRPASTLADGKGRPLARAHALVAAVKNVLGDAIAAGGSTLRDYRQADGSSGGFQDTFLVYDREGERCTRTGCSGRLRRAVHAGRATFFCPVCQR